MQGDLEAIDVENNEYEACDGNGRLLQLRVASWRFDWLQIIRTDKVLTNVDFGEIKEKYHVVIRNTSEKYRTTTGFAEG